MRLLNRLAVILIFMLLPVVAHAVTVEWDANTESDLAGYKVYWGTASRSYSFNQDNGNQTTAIISSLADGRWYFAVTAYDLMGNESGFSAEVSTTIITEPPPPTVTPPGTPTPTTTAQGVRWDWPPCEGCSGYQYRYEGGEGATAETSVLIPDFPGDWFCVTANELGWGDNTLVRCNRYDPPPLDVEPPGPPSNLRITVE